MSQRDVRVCLIALLLPWATNNSAPAQSGEPTAVEVSANTPDPVRVSVERGLARVKQAAANWHKNKTCFACHHQTPPVLAVVEAGRAGFPVDREWLAEQTRHTLDYFAARIDDLRAGEHIPGGAASTAYGLWALALTDHPPDETTAAMVANLLQIQGVIRKSDRKPDTTLKAAEASGVAAGRWEASCRRAPIQASLAGDTVLVLLGLDRYGTTEQRAEIAKADAAAEAFLAQLVPQDQQDRLWKLRDLLRPARSGRASAPAGSPHEALAPATADLLARQHEDGGWSESDSRDSDAYTTGQTLYFLRKAGVAADHPALARGKDWLVRSQLPDGSWRTESHVKVKVQPWYDNGDPHGEHQYLSTAATAWATAGLAALLPDHASMSLPEQH